MRAGEQPPSVGGCSRPLGNSRPCKVHAARYLPRNRRLTGSRLEMLVWRTRARTNCAACRGVGTGTPCSWRRPTARRCSSPWTTSRRRAAAAAASRFEAPSGFIFGIGRIALVFRGMWRLRKHQLDVAKPWRWRCEGVWRSLAPPSDCVAARVQGLHRFSSPRCPLQQHPSVSAHCVLHACAASHLSSAVALES